MSTFSTNHESRTMESLRNTVSSKCAATSRTFHRGATVGASHSLAGNESKSSNNFSSTLRNRGAHRIGSEPLDGKLIVRPNLLVNVSLAFLLLPLDAIDVVGVSRKNLVAQLARADNRIEIDEVNNLAYRFVGVFAVKLPQLVIIAVPLEQSLQYLVSSIDLARLHAKLHRTKHLEPFKRL